MQILSLDLSSDIVGWSVMDKNKKLIGFGQIELFRHKKKKSPLEYVKVLYSEISNILSLYKIEECVIEDTYAINVLTIKSLCRIRGIAEASLLNNGIKNIHLINATSARKLAFNNGKLKKEQCFEKLKSLYPDDYDKFETKGFDISDSIVLAIGFINKKEKGD